MYKVVRRTLAASALVAVAAAGVAAPAFAGSGHEGHEDHHGHHGHRGHHDRARLLIHDNLVGSLTTDAPIFGVAPGGADWTVSRSTATVTADGRADVHVRDLVLTGTGANPVTTISASLYCNGSLADTVGPVAFDTAGNARIRDTFTVPDRCLAPTLMLNPVDRVGTYIAISGQA